MAWTYEQLFNTLNDGDLHGQDSWSGDTAFDVQTSVKYEGAKAVQCISSTGVEKIISRSITSITAGVVYFAMRKTSNSAGNSYVFLTQGGVNKTQLRFGSDGHIYLAATDLGTYNANQWYVFNVEFDDTNQNDKNRVRINSGAGWGAWSDWVATSGTYTAIDGIRLESYDGDGITCYWDTITPTDLTVGIIGPFPTFLPS